MSICGKTKRSLNLDVLDLWLVSIGAFGRPNIIVLWSLSLEPSKGSTLGLLSINSDSHKYWGLT